MTPYHAQKLPAPPPSKDANSLPTKLTFSATSEITRAENAVLTSVNVGRAGVNVLTFLCGLQCESFGGAPWSAACSRQGCSDGLEIQLFQVPPILLTLR